jgi:transposase
MNDQIVQSLKKAFPTSHRSVTNLIEKLNPFIRSNFRKKSRRGKKHISLKKALAAFFYRIKTGCSWRQIPEFFGNWRTIYGLFRKIALHNFLENLYKKLVAGLLAEKPNLLKHIIFDGSLIPSKNGGSHAKRNPRAQNKSVVNVIFMSNGKGLALNLLIAPGTANDSKLLQPLFISSRSIFKDHAPSKTHADKGFDSMSNRVFLIKNGSVPCIPYREYKNRMYPKRLPDRIRGRIEHCFARLKQFKGLMTTFNRSKESLKADLFMALMVIFAEKTRTRLFNSCFSSI